MHLRWRSMRDLRRKRSMSPPPMVRCLRLNDKTIAQPRRGTTSSCPDGESATMGPLMKQIMLPAILMATIGATHADTVYVAPGHDLGDAIGKNPPHTTFIIRRGVHKNAKIHGPKTGQAFIGEDGAVLEGDTGIMYCVNGWRQNGEGDSVTVRNLEIRGYWYEDCGGAAVLMEPFSKGWVFEDNEVHHNGGVGVIFGSHCVIRNNYIHHNTMQGVGCGGNCGEGYKGNLSPCSKHAVFENNEVAWNNWDAERDTNFCEWGHTGGGSKFAVALGLVVKNNWSHHNWGPGFWTDVANDSIVYEGNLVEHNIAMGIFHEISWGVEIRCNISRQNGVWVDFGGDQQILLTSAGPAEVWGNIVEVNALHGGGITWGENRRLPFRSQDISVHHNTIIFPGEVGTAIGAGCQWYDSCAMFYETNCWNHSIDYNTYYVPSKDCRLWRFNGPSYHGLTWDDFTALHELGAHGTVIETDDFPSADDIECPDGCEDILSPSMIMSPRRLTVRAAAGGGNPVPHTMTIRNKAKGRLDRIETNVVYHDGDGWLGISTPDGAGNMQRIVNSVDVSGLATGEYLARVEITCDNATPSYMKYLVWLYVEDGGSSAGHVVVTPDNATVSPGQTVRFDAVVVDRLGNPLSVQPAVTWTVDGEGSVAAGLYTPPSTLGGPYTITASAGSAGGSAEVAVMRALPLVQDGSFTDIQGTSQTGFIKKLLTIRGSDDMPVAVVGDGNTGVDNVLVPGIGGLWPIPGDKIAILGTDYTWSIEYEDDAFWNDNVREKAHYWVDYFFIALVSPVERQVRIGTRHMGGIKIWLNGNPVHQNGWWDGWGTEATVPVTLKKGHNRLMLKLTAGDGDSYFAVQVAEENGRLLTDLQYSLGGDNEQDLVARASARVPRNRLAGLMVRRAAGRFLVDVSGAGGGHELQLLTLSGRTIMKRRGAGNAVYSVPRAVLARGVYLVSLRSSTGVIRTKLVAY
ncbi:MAG: hypothetical protein GF418_13410 [Chitinivibrionales bacterium]|nr:hypothetical protein [Chitinivibrionales bacterium]MBD3396617.1 hypothetical protein [Chitinivibrionales bacterium]